MKYPELNATDPSTCLSGKVSRISRITANIFRKHIKPFGLSNSQMGLLLLLSKKNDLTQKDICDILYMEKSTLNRNLKRLFDNKCVTKIHFPEIRITENGKALLEQVIPAWKKAMVEVRNLLEEDGEEAVNTVLNKLKNTIS
ncbi:MAG: MarR family winged helix-turn-helix transcriptional regulator [Bacteroidota bacterium]